MSSRSENHTDEESAYRAIFEASSDGLVINDAETGIVLEANPALCRMHGYDQMVGLHPTAFIHPDSHQLFDAYIRAVRSGRDFRTRAQDVRRDGTVFDVEVVGRGFVYQGRFAVLGVVRDMTEHVRAYQDLERRVSERTREIERRREVAEALSELLNVVNSRRALDDILSAVVAQAARLLDSDAEALYLVDEVHPELLRLHASRNIPPEAQTATVPLGHVLDLGSASVNQATRQYRNELLAERFHSLVVVPLMARGTTHGALMLAYRVRHAPADDERELIAAFAGQAGLAIENARLHEESELRRQELEAFYRADQALHRSLRLEDVLDVLVDLPTAIGRAEMVTLLLWDDQQRQFVFGGARGLSDAMLGQTFSMADLRMPRQSHADIVEIEDAATDPRVSARLRTASIHEGVSAWISYPIRIGGSLVGTFSFGYRRPHVFTNRERRLLTAMAQRAALAIQKTRLHEESERQRRELEALYEADAALHRSLRLQDVLKALVDAAVTLLHVDGVALWGPDPRLGNRVAPLASHGLSTRYLLESARLNDEPGVLEFWQEHDSLVIEDVLGDSRIPESQRLQLAREGYRALLTTQIRIGADPFGSFTVGRRTPHRFGAQEQRLLTALAQRAGLAIQNARLYEQAQQAATLEERQRLARELHDAVTQTLFSTALIAEVLPELWDLDAREARARLADLRRLTRGALAEMRALLVELRPDALTQLTLGDLLRQLADATAGRSRLEVDVHVDGPVRWLPPGVHIALYRLAQEALNNVVKHAEAQHAWLKLSFTADGARLQVRDDGRGFVTEAAALSGHFGLGIMRERATSIGGHLRLQSRPGEGTHLEVTWTETVDRWAASPSSQVQDSPTAG